MPRDIQKRQLGLVFCCLPTPIITGLAVHVDGRWELSRDRTHMAHAAEGAATEQSPAEKGEDVMRAEWNSRLACGVAAIAYSPAFDRT